MIPLYNVPCRDFIASGGGGWRGVVLIKETHRMLGIGQNVGFFLPAPPKKKQVAEDIIINIKHQE